MPEIEFAPFGVFLCAPLRPLWLIRLEASAHMPVPEAELAIVLLGCGFVALYYSPPHPSRFATNLTQADLGFPGPVFLCFPLRPSVSSAVNPT